jgi:hypothetical protein
MVKLTTVFIWFFLFSSGNIYGQTRTITGQVIDEQLTPVYEASIYNSDTILLGTTADDGTFRISISAETKSLLFFCIGRERKYVALPSNCDYLEIILLNRWTFDFISARNVDRLRMKQFKNLPELHKVAHSKGIFCKRNALL